MPETRLKRGDAPGQLRNDHERLRDLFAEFRQLGEGPRRSKKDLFERIRRELAVHALVEEDVYYPAIEDAPNREARTLVSEARQGHRVMKTLLAELGAMGIDDEAFDLRMAVLREDVERHAGRVDLEMARIFRHLPPGIREDVSARLRARKIEMGSIVDPE